jgi:two-component system LytT family sensor kinase
MRASGRADGPLIMQNQHLLLVNLLLKLGVIAAIASVLVRSRVFKRYLYLERRNLRQRLVFTAFVSLPLAAGVAIRLTVPSFSSADLMMQGAFLVGLMAGQLAGAVSGAVIAAPALGVAHEWLALPLGVVAGLCGAICRGAAPNLEEIWTFSPFIDLEIWRWLRNRLNRPFRDWQALVFALLIGLTLLQLGLQQLFPRRLYAPPATTGWDVVFYIAATVLSVAIPIKIWNNTRIEIKLEEQQRLLVQSRLDALTSQINPHFLFNTLNSVASLVRFDPDTARQLIVKLSSILRRLLQIHESFVPLRDELSFIDDYLDIEVVRFGSDKLRVVKDVDPAVLDVPVPSMILQPIVENSVRHGLSPKVAGGCITLRAKRSEAGLILEVADDGIGIAPERLLAANRGGIGLSNVRERLDVLFGDTARLRISSDAGRGTTIRIELPELTPAVLRGASSHALVAGPR